MKFIPDHDLDAKRLLYKTMYDQAFSEIRKHPVGSQERAEANKLELKLHNRTRQFIEKHRFYFSQKRLAIFRDLETKCVFGDKPASDAHIESRMSSSDNQYCGIVRLKNGRLYKKGGSRQLVEV
jgi:hypothetical protein